MVPGDLTQNGVGTRDNGKEEEEAGSTDSSFRVLLEMEQETQGSIKD